MTRPYPFLQPAFIDALATTGATGVASGWTPLHLDDGDSWMPLYLKTHHQGEYVFDHGWADAYARYGRNYYPRLVSAVPYTPVEGPRWRGPLPADAWQQIAERVAEYRASSWHLLFADADSREALGDWPLIARDACHFRWFNRGYRTFDDFLAALTSRRRKSIRKERQAIEVAGITVQQATGSAIPSHWWPLFYRCYANTYLVRGQRPYLSAAFFQQLASSALAEQLLLVLAFANDQPLAAAFYLFDEQRLYGRYWGALRDVSGLHFELCYYQGIAFCIEQGLQQFDPGVQGEHKILRGFEPVITRSLHWLAEPAFHQAVADACQREAAMVARYQEEARTLLPYREG